MLFRSTASAKILPSGTRTVVVDVPTQRYPGAVVQGDTL